MKGEVGNGRRGWGLEVRGEGSDILFFFLGFWESRVEFVV